MLKGEGSSRAANLLNTETLDLYCITFSETLLRLIGELTENKMEEKDKKVFEQKKEEIEEDPFFVEEITIEEISIDGICGVY